MISSTIRTAGPFTSNGSQTIYPFSFKVFSVADLLVGQTDLAGVQSTVTAYTVTLNSDQNASPGGTVNLTAPLTTGFIINITSAVAATQPASLTNAGGFYPATIEDALDRLTILYQQLAALAVGANLRVPDLGGIAVLPSSTLRAGKMFTWDVNGAPSMVSIPVGGVATSVISDTAAFTEALLSSAGVVKFAQQNQGSVRKAEYLLFGSANAGAYGIAPGMAGVNTGAGVDYSIGVNDGALIMRFNSTLGLAGVNKQPVAGKGLIQLNGSAAGGLALGNVDNTDSSALDWYEEGVWTVGNGNPPSLYIGALLFSGAYSAQSGSWQRIGNRVFFDFIVQINGSPGAQTGGVALGPLTLPYAPLAGAWSCVVRGTGLNLSSPYGMMVEVAGGGNPQKMSVLLATALGHGVATQAILGASCSFSVSGNYRCA